MRVDGMAQDKFSYELMKKALDASTVRGKVIANNMANINTKGYKRFNVSFEETLKDEMNDVSMKRTDERHIKDGQEFGDIGVKQDTSSSMREDGNNVDLESEKVNQAANTLMYNTLISQVNSRLSSLRYVITGGGR